MNNLTITKERLKAWSPCTSGYQWFLENFPQGAQFGEIHKALHKDKRFGDGTWLAEKVFAELDVPTRVGELVKIAGAVKSEIEELAKNSDEANAATTGEGANAATTGYRANAATTGNWANAATTGDEANAATTGYRANAATTGDEANAATTGNWANAATTGEGANAATTGEGAVAASLGGAGKAKAETGGAIVLVHRGERGVIVHIRASKVGENGVKPGVWYSLDANGEFVEVSE